MSTYEELSFEFEAVVVNSNDGELLTGIYSSEHDIPGWRWDRRIVEDPATPSAFYGEYIGGHSIGLKDGLRQSWWRSGTLGSLDYSGLQSYRSFDSFTWTPVFTIGPYSVLAEDRILFSDFSHTARFNTEDNTNGVNYIELRDDCLDSTISINLYARDTNLINRLRYGFDYVDSFTGALQYGADSRLSTGSGDTVLWSNLCDRVQEYRVIDGGVYLNGDWTVTVGGYSGAITNDILEDSYEDAGSGNSTGRRVYTELFPIQDSSVSLYVSDGSSVEEWTEVSNLNFSTASDNHFCVDEDLGIITVGGYQAPGLVLKEDIDEDDDEILVFRSEDIESYPSQGIIVIGDEQIYYGERGGNGFYDCIRGYGGTIADPHIAYSAVADVQHGASVPSTSTIYVGYVAVPRIEYEVTDYELRSACPSLSPLNLKPASRLNSIGIVQVSASTADLAEIVLEVDRETISSNLYGPLYFGTDTARLTATAYDSSGNPVEGVDLTIDLDSGPGYLAGGLSSYSFESNSDGQIYALYYSPYDWDSIGQTVTSITHSGSDTLIEALNLPSGLSPSDITLYQILKHDASSGTQGEKTEVSSGSNDGTLDDGTIVGASSIIIENVYTDAVSRFNGGYVYLLCDDNVTYYREIVHVTNEYAADGMIDGHKLYLDSSVPGLGTGLPVRAWLMTANAEEFSTSSLSGLPVLMYEWNDNVQHPLTGASGAFYPLLPDSIASGTLTYSGRSLAEPAPSDRTSNLGAYLLVTSSIASFSAWGKDPVSGRIITSNTVRLRIDLPEYLRGVDYSGALPIPYGFTFISESHNVGTGLGGANFLTINPKAEYVSFFTLNTNFG